MRKILEAMSIIGIGLMIVGILAWIGLLLADNNMTWFTGTEGDLSDLMYGLSLQNYVVNYLNRVGLVTLIAGLALEGLSITFRLVTGRITIIEKEEA